MTTNQTPVTMPAGSLDLLGSSSAGGCCGGGGCMCGPAATEVAAADTAAEGATAEFLVTGMTCGHCVASVTEEVGAIAGVDHVEVVLKKGGASRVSVTSAEPVDAEAVRAAVEEAGYQLAP